MKTFLFILAVIITYGIFGFIMARCENRETGTFKWDTVLYWLPIVLGMKDK